MDRALPWSGAFVAGLAWLFLARLIGDALAPAALTPLFVVPPVVVFVFCLPMRVALVSVAFMAFAHDAVRPGPFGITATIVLPVAALLWRLRGHFRTTSRRQAAATACVLTPSVHILLAIAMAISGRSLPGEVEGFAAELAIGALVALLGTAWLMDFAEALLRLFGARNDIYAEGES